jgi:hypothetical protein
MIKSELARKDISTTDKFLLILSALRKPAATAEIKLFARNNGWTRGSKTNPAPYLKSGGAVRTPKGWEHTHQSELRLTNVSTAFTENPLTPLADNLLQTIESLGAEENKRFLTEAVGCMRGKHFRAAIVLSWVGALWVLYNRMFSGFAAKFVSEAQTMGFKNFQVKNVEDFSKIHKESIFLEIAEKVGAISKTERKELVACLDRRNDAGHPNDFDPGEGLVAGHIEVLIKHVFSKA